jgi:transposase InsO family protein
VVADQTYRQRDEPQGSKEKPPDGGPLDLLGSLLQRDRPGECAVRAISVQSVVPIGEDRAATGGAQAGAVAHEFAAERPNQKWIADFTYI